jgi:hypothetical protein
VQYVAQQNIPPDTGACGIMIVVPGKRSATRDP